MLTNDPIDKYLSSWLSDFRENLWRTCKSPTGLCDLEDLDKALKILVKQYNDFLYSTGAPIEIKNKTYSVMREIIDQVIEFIRKTYPGYNLSTEIERPSSYRLELNMRNIQESGLRKLILEIRGAEGLASRYEIKRSREVLELPIGTYQLRIYSGDKELFSDVIKVSGDSSLTIDLPKRRSREQSTRDLLSGRGKVVVQIPRRRIFRRISVKNILKRLSRLDIVSIALLIILVVIDLLILLLIK